MKNTVDNISPRSRTLIKNVLQINGLDSLLIEKIVHIEKYLDREIGVVALIRSNTGESYTIINVPVLIMPMNGVTLNIGETMDLVSSLRDIPNAQYALKGSVLYFTCCSKVTTNNEAEIETSIKEIVTAADNIHREIFMIFNHFYPPKSDTDQTEILEPKLPNIKMTPEDAKIIYGVLLLLDQNTRQIYTFLMESWARAGFFVETTKSSIVLDVPHGQDTTRLAILLPGISKEISVLYPNTLPRPPLIVLRWESLRQESGFPAPSINKYQETIKKIAVIHTTENNAHVENVDSMDLTTGRKLFKAMLDLAKSVQPENIEVPKPFVPVTPMNISDTLELCDAHTRSIFIKIINAWKEQKGIIQCKRVGRIELKLKTKTHEIGKYATLERKFNLLVLESPKGNEKASIQITWDLGCDKPFAYLDCIPGQVQKFEELVSSLPSFTQKGTITRVVIDKSFQGKHASILSDAIIQLKEAEILCP